MKFLAGLLVCSTLLFAQTQKLVIDAEQFEASDNKGISSFTGNVKIKMGKDKLNANKVDIYFVSQKGTNVKTPSKYIATGNVDFELVTKLKHYIGKGNKIIYSPSKQEYTVIGNGFLQEKNDNRKIYGDKIYVNQLTGEARVSGSEDKPVRFIINIQQGQEGKK
ncbi:lipopolysaccharide transport periplasmic protein LptA [Poseidonibacter lekithochrous]|uniref:lipopolysaccharide transport periplasmic protein LptA n=1 Tax=Poseidonibacter lekithochrous TaxID=1904463 RepID=UPI000ADAEA20|nr:lipopolysaccharide transport periplasmic protein LptA [Poseidonibacter lekithochrous]QKJ23426.1 lipooligosaccharide transport system, periplasmic component LptA [Poseidonibacter lekithochrous]